MRRSLSAVLTLWALPFPILAQGIITTVAGTEWVFPRTALAAKDAPLGRVTALAVDTGGNLYVTDTGNHTVVKVSPDGKLTIAAGNGLKGFSGDGGAATSASLDTPMGLAIDSAGNLYISDTGNCRIRMVTPGGVITTVAGTGTPDFSGDGGPATKANLNQPQSLALDTAGNLFVSDTGNARIRRITSAGTISTVAGNEKAGLSGDGGPATSASLGGVVFCIPTNAPIGIGPPCPNLGIAVDAAGNLFIADTGNHRIRRVDRQGIITTVAGTGQSGFAGDGGPAGSAMLNDPTGILADSAGSLYISDCTNLRVRRVSSAGVISTFAGNGLVGLAGDGGLATAASFQWPVGLARDAGGNLFIADSSSLRVRRVTPAGIITTVAGNGRFRFFGDGSTAPAASLNFPRRAAVDAAGNLYIADTDNQRIRKVTPVGIISTFAGSGQPLTAGAQVGPATEMPLAQPSAVILDAQSNLLIADTFHQTVQRVTADGIMREVPGTPWWPDIAGVSRGAGAGVYFPTGLALDSAGNLFIASSYLVYRVSPNGVPALLAGKPDCSCEFCVCRGFAGDGGPATAAQLLGPNDVAVDAGGNVYIADTFNNRIRRVAPDGIISTVAGNDSWGFSGDGGPAVKASLNGPYGVTVDATGNLYIADTNNHRIRRVSPSGVITTVAGNGRPGYSGDGGLGLDASLNQPTDVKLDKVGNILITDSANSRIRVVLAAPQSFQVSPTSLSFTATQGAFAPPSKTITLSSSIGLSFTASTATTDGGAWLSVSQTSGYMPAVLGVSVDAGALAPGAYTGTLTITVAGAAPSSRTVSVSLQVEPPATQPELSLETKELTFRLLQGGGESSVQLTVSNVGGGTLSFTANASTGSGGDWLQVTPASGTATPAQPASITIAVRPAKLEAGTYQGKVTVAGAGTTRTVPVTLVISAPQPMILLSQTGLTFTAVSQGGTVLPQTIGILNTGSGSLDWTARVSMLSGSGWLSISPTSGTVSRPFLDVSFLDVSVDGRALASGDYFGRVDITAPGADNSPQTLMVVLNVLPPGANPGPQVRPTGLIFTTVAGAGNPGSQSVNVSNVSGTAVTYGSSQTYVGGGKWFAHVPLDATVAPDTPERVVVQPDFTGLAPGILRAYLNLGFSDGSSRTVSILSVLAPPSQSGTAAGSPAKPGERLAGGCSPSRLRIVPTSLPQVFTASLSQPTAVEVQIVDDCGAPVTRERGGTAVRLSMSNGDPSVDLVHTQEGHWAGSWQPRHTASGAVRITITAFLALPNGTVLAEQVEMSATLTTGAAVPLVNPGAVVNGASFVAQSVVAPGTLVSVFGSRLADGTASSELPMSNNLGGTQVVLGGKPVPLRYASDGQLNAQMPYDIPVNTQLQLLVQRGSALSVPEVITVASAEPAIFTMSQTGVGQGAVVNGVTNVLADSANPVKAGDVVTIYCTGLGKVDPPVAAGAVTPTLPLSWTVNPVTVTMGGLPAQVQFEGLTPSKAGLYQVNAFVPDGVAPGDQVPVVLTVAGQSSPPVTMAVR